VIGNGESRSNIDLNSFKVDHILIGCNAVHRDITVDHLVCCDRRMVEEAIKNPANARTDVYVRNDWFKYYRKIEKLKNIHIVPELPYSGELKQDKPEHWGSGGYAILLAACLEFKDIKLVGFDLYSTNNKVNNIYKGTENYAKPESHSVDHSYWVYQIAKVFKYYPESKFTIVNNSNWQMPKEWQYSNVEFETIGELIY